jgi:hypothetical protein
MPSQPNWWDEDLPPAVSASPVDAAHQRAADHLSFVLFSRPSNDQESNVLHELSSVAQTVRASTPLPPVVVRDLLRRLDACDRESLEPAARHHLKKAEIALADLCASAEDA